jgi:hypothetical protein
MMGPRKFGHNHDMDSTGHRNPLLYAWWLETVGQITKLRGALFIGAVVAGIILALSFGSQLLAAATPHVITIGMVAAILTSVWVQSSRHKWSAYYSEGWLAGLHVSRAAVTRTIALRSVLLPTLAAAALAALLAVAGLHTAGQRTTTAHLSGSLGVALITGLLLGWWMPKKKARPRGTRRLYVVATEGGSVAGLRALSQWTGLLIQQWFDPRALSRLFMVIMLAAPMNTSANQVVVVLALVAIFLYLVVTQLAVLRVMRQCKSWLLPTPVSRRRMVWAVLRSALFRQCLWTGLAAATLVACGLAAMTAVRVAEWWLALCSVTTVLLTADAGRPRANGIKLVVILACMMLADRIRPHLALPTALLVSIFRFRKLERA